MTKPISFGRANRLPASLMLAALWLSSERAQAQIEAPRVPEEAEAPVAAPPASEPSASPVTDTPAGEDKSVSPVTTSSAADLGSSPAVVATLSPAPEPAFADDALVIRAPAAGVTLFPGARLQLDGYAYRSANDTPRDTFLVRRARVEASGWIGRAVYFAVAGEYASAQAPGAAGGSTSQNSWAPTDEIVALAPWAGTDRLIFQVGQFDAPFTLENRTLDQDLHFMERSITVRAFGAPDNKDVGAMLHGTTDARTFHWSYGVFNGDGPNGGNLDRHLDSIARAWIAPFAFAGQGPLSEVELGASGRLGDRASHRPLGAQTTSGGFAFLSFEPYDATLGGTHVPVQLRQVGLLRSFAAELNAPIARRFGLRGELVWRHSPLSEESLADPSSPVILGGANLTGWAGYGELWFWPLGDDRLGGDQQGREPFKRAGTASPDPAGDPMGGPARHGVMVVLRVERLFESITHEADAAALPLHNPAQGTTRVTSLQAGINFWHSRRFRAAANYSWHHLGGNTLMARNFPGAIVQEVSVRLGVVL